jgi:hypothetical protein
MVKEYTAEELGISQPKREFTAEELNISPSKSISKRTGEPSTFEKIGGFASGVAKGVASAPGEVEEFLTTPGNKETRPPDFLSFLPSSNKPMKLLGAGSMFPDIKETGQALKSVGIDAPAGTKTQEKIGEFVGNVGVGVPGLMRGLGKSVGLTTEEGARIAGIAEKLGFKLSPSQVRESSPVAEKGALGYAKSNQTLANRLASSGTGKEVNEITPIFLRERLKTLGDDFETVYKGQVFNIDTTMKGQIENILAREEELGFAGVSTVKQAAQSIVDRIDTGKILGDDLQRLRNALTQTARSSTNRGKSHEIYELVDVLDKAVENKNPAMKATLATLRPQYRNTIILEDLYNADGIKNGNISLERLGAITFNSGQLRRNPQDIDGLGMIGNQLGLRAMWETAGESMPGAVKGAVRTHGLLPEAIRGLSTPLRSATARKAQKAESRGVNPVRGTAEALGTTLAPYEFSKNFSKPNE